MPARPQSTASAQKLGLAALLGLVAGILIVSVAEILRPTVPGARRVSRRLGVPMLGQLGKEDLTGTRTAAVGELALRLRLVTAHADLRTIALVDVDGKRELGPPRTARRIARARTVARRGTSTGPPVLSRLRLDRGLPCW
jgi:hypothetical protein